MKIFVTGATGFVGSAVVQELLQAGHQVLGLARTEEAAAALARTGAAVHRGTLEDTDSLRRGVEAADGVIHTAYIHDFSNIAASAVVDEKAIATMGDVLAGSGRPLVVTSGTATLPRGRVGHEGDEPDRESAGKHRIASEDLTRALAERGVRSCVLRLPPSVHGDGDHGFVPALIGIARGKGLSAYVGDGQNRWPAVHRLDAARLFRLVAEKGVAGASYHAVADAGIPTREIAEIIGRRLNLPVVAKAPEEVMDHFGWLGRFFSMDCPSSSEWTRRQLGWEPVHAGLLADLDHERYFQG